jgi:RNA polymerase sigma-70 factor, ECF subfamily
MGTSIYLFVNTMEQEAQELARGLRRRDPDLLDELIARYHYRLLRYLWALTGNRESAEDLFQETWMRVLERGNQFSPRWKFETWLFSIAHHLAIDLLRRHKPESLDALLSERAAPPQEWNEYLAATPFEEAAAAERSEQVETLLQRLPSESREVLVLRFQEDLDLQEIATVVAAPLSTVKSRLYRTLDALRNLLKENSV